MTPCVQLEAVILQPDLLRRFPGRGAAAEVAAVGEPAERLDADGWQREDRFRNLLDRQKRSTELEGNSRRTRGVEVRIEAADERVGGDEAAEHIPADERLQVHDLTCRKEIRLIEREARVGHDEVRAHDPAATEQLGKYHDCLLYTSPSPRDRQKSRMPSSA